MTTHYITANQGALKTGTGDSTFEASGVVISGGIDMTYQSDDVTTNGGGDQTLDINGGVLGGIADDASMSGNDQVTIGSGAYVDSASTAILLEGGGDSLVNSGMISGSASGAAVNIFGAVGIDLTYTDTIVNTGVISATLPIGASNGGAIDCNDVVSVDITNSGSVLGAGDLDGIYVVVGVGGSGVIANSGLVVGGIDFSGGVANVTNTGDIEARLSAGVAISLDGAGSTIDNSGKIDGAVTLGGAGSSLTDSGEIDGEVSLAGASSGATDVTVTHTGLLTYTPDPVLVSSGPDLGALAIAAGAYDIKIFGEITAAQNSSDSAIGDAIEVDGAGTITNDGKIYAAGVGIDNSDANSSDFAYIYNYGTISGTDGGLADTGGHDVDVYNYGHINGGAIGDAISSDASTYEYIFNAGVIAGMVQLGALGSGMINSGTIDGETILTSEGSITNTGTMVEAFFGGTESGSTLQNSGTITFTVTAEGAHFVLHNSGTIDGAVSANGHDSTIVNSDLIEGGVTFGLGGADFIDKGEVIGNVTFAGTGNTYNGGLGSVTGVIDASGSKGTYIGGADNDTFVFAAATLSSADIVRGGGADDTLKFSSAGAISASALANVSGFETIDLANGTNNITLTDALANSADNATLAINGGSGKDTINARGVTTATDSVIIDGGAGADTIDAGAARDTFAYHAASDSTGANYDTISGANFAHDVFDIPGAPGAIKKINAEVTTKPLSTATFNTSLAAAIGAAQLGAHDAVLIKASGGSLNGQTFLVVDLNGVAGYQANADLVVHLTGATGTLATANFV